jgi:hypothetical protein
MRTLALAATSVLVAAGLVTGASAHDRTAALGPVSCGTAKTFTYLFWPQGHPAIPSVNFQNFPVPHLELYIGRAARSRIRPRPRSSPSPAARSRRPAPRRSSAGSRRCRGRE